ncbi:MAG: hypothetical protein QXS48_01880 [Candidatus Aenigmatarchaeota archaeon]
MRKVYLVFGLLFLFILFLYVYQPLGENFFIISDIIPIFLSFLAFVFGLYSYKFYGSTSLQGKAFLFLTLGTFFWFLGETTWGIYEIIFGIKSPVGSIADVFWLVGYPLFLLGLWYVRKISSTKIRKPKLLFLLFFSILVLVFTFYLIKEDVFNPEVLLSEKIFSVGYVVCDIVLIISSTFAVVNLFETKIFRAYFLIILGIISMSIADIYYMKFLETYASSNLIDLWWDLSYILLAVGFFHHRKIMKDLLKK